MSQTDSRNNVSMKQHLAALGWNATNLSWDGRVARLDLVSGEACFVPFRRLRRWFSAKRLPVKQILVPGMRVIFPRSLDHETFAISGVLGFIAGLFLKLSNQRPESLSVFNGFVTDVPNPPYSTFPFNQALTVKEVQKFRALYEDQEAGLGVLA
jgi:hypothetical protein